MKYPTQSGTIVSIVVGLVIASLLPSTLDARIGERRESIERRLFSSGGIVYRDDSIEESRRKGMPYTQYLEYSTLKPPMVVDRPPQNLVIGGCLQGGIYTWSS